jgi:hypothetical protein
MVVSAKRIPQYFKDLKVDSKIEPISIMESISEKIIQHSNIDENVNYTDS